MKLKYITAGTAVGLIILVVSLVFLPGSDNEARAQQFTADDYRDGQEQFIRLIGEEAFANFEHNHPPLDCTEAEWEENTLSCSELWQHRSVIGGYVLPEFRGKGRPASESSGPPATPTTAPEQRGENRH